MVASCLGCFERCSTHVTLNCLVSPDDCYISYENAPVQWLLEDGSRPPARKPFENAHYNEATRTFIGTINWSEATFGGDARWEYEMKFSDDFVVISGGQMTGFDRDGNQTRTHPFPEALRYVREYQLPKTIVGQAYMQGGGLGVASYHFPQIDQAYISYEAAPPEWSLDDGSRPPQRKPFDNPRYDETTRTFTGTIDWSETPFAGDARWEYEMIFSEDLTRITGGQVRTFHSSGAASMRGTSEFGRNLHSTLYIEEQAQLFHLFTLGFRARAAAVTGPSPQGSGLQQIRLAISSFIARTWSPRQFNTDARAPGDADADGLEPPSVQEPSAQGEQSASTSAPVAGEGMGDDDGSGGGRG